MNNCLLSFSKSLIIAHLHLEQNSWLAHQWPGGKLLIIQPRTTSGPTVAQQWPNSGPTVAQQWPNSGPTVAQQWQNLPTLYWWTTGGMLSG